MKCTRLADWLETKDELLVGPEWETELCHARSCFDCSSFLKRRGELIETLENLPPPPIPLDLHERIVQTLEFSKVSEVSEPSPIFDKLLVPIQIVAAAVCLFAAVNLVNKPLKPFPDREDLRNNSASIRQINAKSREVRKPKPGESLVRLSDTEVRDFMKKLDNYRKLHPEMNPPSPRPVPVDLVDYRGF